MAVSTSPADLSAALVLQPVAALDWLVILPVAWCIGIGAVLTDDASNVEALPAPVDF